MKDTSWRVAGGMWILGLAGCGSPVPAPPAPVPAAPPAPPAIVFFGDSLTAGYGVAPEEAFPFLIGKHLQAARLPYRVVNAGVSGDTTAGGLRRLEWALQGPIAWVVVGLGANDGLRGVPLEETRKNIDALIRAVRGRGPKVLLVGMKLPVNYGPHYREPFERMYRDLAASHRIPLIPFLLEGVGGDPALNQADGLHPNAAGHRRIADHVWRTLRPLL